MQWDDKKEHQEFVISDEVTDIQFKLDSKAIPVDHLHILSNQINSYLPWFDSTPDAALHLIHGAESGNGWVRASTSGAGTEELMYLSKRTKLTLRVPKAQLDDTKKLSGKVLDFNCSQITIGKATVKPLSVFPNLFSRYIISDQSISEDAFIERIYNDFKHLGVNCSKMLCGRHHTFQLPGKTLFTRSLMIADLEPQESAILQQHGYGEGMSIGCGIFVPHKDIVPVANAK